MYLVRGYGSEVIDGHSIFLNIALVRSLSSSKPVINTFCKVFAAKEHTRFIWHPSGVDVNTLRALSHLVAWSKSNSEALSRLREFSIRPPDSRSGNLELLGRASAEWKLDSLIDHLDGLIYFGPSYMAWWPDFSSMRGLGIFRFPCGGNGEAGVEVSVLKSFDHLSQDGTGTRGPNSALHPADPCRGQLLLLLSDL